MVAEDFLYGALAVAALPVASMIIGLTAFAWSRCMDAISKSTDENVDEVKKA